MKLAAPFPRDRLVRRARGQFAVLFAIAIVALLGAASLAADVAVIYFQYTSLQTATDAAALAGANYLPTQVIDAINEARNCAEQNGVKAAEITLAQPNYLGTQITVSTTRQVPSFFAKVLGIGQFTIHATAVAESQPAGAVQGVIPVGLDSLTPYVTGQTITMHQGPAFNPDTWGGLALGGTGSSVFESNLANGYSGTVSIGDMVSTEPGATTGPTQDGINARVNAGLAFDGAATWMEHQLTDPRAVTVPLIDWASANGGTSVQVVGFAEVWVTGVSGTDIAATFIGQAVRGTATSGAPNAGALHVALVR